MKKKLYGTLRTGTVHPFGYYEPTLLNFILMRQNRQSYLSGEYTRAKGTLHVIWIILSHPYRRFWCRLKYRFTEKVYWRIRCKLGHHQKSQMYPLIGPERIPWCYWCHRKIPEWDATHKTIPS